MFSFASVLSRYFILFCFLGWKILEGGNYRLRIAKCSTKILFLQFSILFSIQSRIEPK